ncbi:mechanosensitive ion channel family protein [Candidatus Manganitrophus noduliformans]|uniref:CmpX protein n=1 Tax=Candidatus Manganitrophus noduliformans TaxID=2606439 RepID=A0A7X6DPU0_9BACT|nr:hypothetical protein [Candidatus Manganitrophus noduliformans]NKE71172.1 hypothetical protein [Candidatus Manganitrophus noduliformans]
MSEAVMKGLAETMETFTRMVAAFVPKLLVMIIIILVGWVITIFLRALARRILLLVRFDHLSEGAGFTSLLRRANLPPPSEVVSRLIFWLVWIGFILLGVSALGFPVLEAQIARFFAYLPQLFIGLLLFVIGLVVANFASRAVLLSLVNANVPSARLLSVLTRLFVILLAAAMALEQMAVATGVVVTAFSIAFGAVMLALAIAFGLGGRDLARRILEEQFTGEPVEKEDEISPL